MGAIATFLRDIFYLSDVPPQSTARPCHTTTSFLDRPPRDARRLKEFGLLPTDADDDLESWLARQPVEVRWYDSEQSLSEALRRADKFGSRDSNVVVVLSESVRSDLRTLVRRPPRGGRLILVPGPNWVTRTTSFGDLALAAPRLGWESIERQFTLQEAVAAADWRDAGDNNLIALLPSEMRRPPLV